MGGRARGPAAPAVDDSQRDAVLAALRDTGFVTYGSQHIGAADTAMMRSGMTEAQLAATVAQIPLGYMSKPGDLAGTVLFLASNHASYITGATINVSGGWLMY